MTSTAWALPGDLDAGTWYGEQFHTIFDRILPGGEDAEQIADFLMELTGLPDPLVTEFGVGTGRIARPMARRGAVVTGVDASPLMLDVCRAKMGPADAGLRLVEADIRTWRPDRQADLAYCICATLSNLSTEEDQQQAMQVIASAVRPGGTVVIENGSPALVGLFHGHRDSVELQVPMVGAPDPADVLSLLDMEEGIWQLEYRWTDADEVTGTAVERVRLTGPDDVMRMAGKAGLSWQATYADWVGTGGHRYSPTYVCVFSAPDGSTGA